MSGTVELAFFPIEVLRALSCQLDGLSIGRLWFSGNKLLIYKLAHNGVQRFALKLGARRTKLEFPSLVSHMNGLSDFELSCPKKRIPQNWILPLARLPKSVECLTMNFEISSRSLATTLTGSFVPLKLGQLCPSLTCIRLTGLVLYPNIAGALPSNLESFHLSGLYAFDEEAVALLPGSIKDLCLRKKHYIGVEDKPTKNLLRMPRNLEKLGCDGLPFYDLETAPSTLVHLDFGSAHLPIALLANLRAWKQLNLLQTLKLSFVAESEGDFESFLAATPRSLKTLQLSSEKANTAWTKTSIALLPPTLQRLKLLHFDDSPNVPWDHLGCKSLTSYHSICFSENTTMPTIPSVPLQRISTPFLRSNPEALKAYPHLTYLHIHTLYRPHVELLPDSLTELEVSDMGANLDPSSSLDLLGDGFAHEFPLVDSPRIDVGSSSLSTSQELPIFQVRTDSESFESPSELSNFSSSSTSSKASGAPIRLPKSLTKLTTNGTSLPWIFYTTGALFGDREPQYPCLFEGPTNLTSLILNSQTMHFKTPLSRGLTWSKLLPRTLTHLRINLDVTQVDDNWLQHLPDLRKLQLTVEKVTPKLPLKISSFRHLPDCLQSFRFSCTASIQWVDIFTPSSYLPSKLEKLVLLCPMPNFQEDHLQRLPPVLNFLQVPNHAGIQGSTVKQEMISKKAKEMGVTLHWTPVVRRHRAIS